MPTLTLDNRSSTTLTKDNRSSAGSFTNDNKTADSRYIWVATFFPWSLVIPWANVPENILTLDTKN